MLTTEQLLQAVAQRFVPQFASGANLVCLSATDGPVAVYEKTGFRLTGREALPDAIVHDAARMRLFIIELSTSHGGFSGASKKRMDRAWGAFDLHVVCVSVFPSRRVFTLPNPPEIVWGTVAWFADEPAHIVSFDQHGRYGVTPCAAESHVG